MLVDVFWTERFNAIAQRTRGIVYQDGDLSAAGLGAVKQLLRRLRIGKIQFKTFGADVPGTEVIENFLRLIRIAWKSYRTIVGAIVSNKDIRAISSQGSSDRGTYSCLPTDARDEGGTTNGRIHPDPSILPMGKAQTACDLRL